jgi:hypothetical protein
MCPNQGRLIDITLNLLNTRAYPFKEKATENAPFITPACFLWFMVHALYVYVRQPDPITAPSLSPTLPAL